MKKAKNTYIIILALIVSFFLMCCSNSEISQKDDFSQLINQLDQSIPKLLDKYKTTGATIHLLFI